MPIIPQVGRRTNKIRLLFAAMYFMLTLGAITMIYPFLRMLSLSISSSTDYHEINVVPKYLLDDNRLLAKYADEKYSGDLDLINSLYQSNFPKLEDVKLSAGALSSEERNSLQIWQKSLEKLPQEYQAAGFRGYGTHPSSLGKAYRDRKSVV